MVHGKLFFFAAFLFKAEQKPVPGRIIVFDLQVHDGADPGESVGKDPEQSAIAEARVRGCVDHAQELLNFTFHKRRRFAFGPGKSLGLDFPGRVHCEHSFFGKPGKQHPDRRHVRVDGPARSMRIGVGKVWGATTTASSESDIAVKAYTKASPFMCTNRGWGG